MADKWIIYHNPRCSKSRATMGILEEAGIEPQVVEYLKQAPTTAELDGLFKKLGREPQTVIRFGESVAKDLGISKNDQRSRKEWIKLIADNPILLERPIVVRGDQARLGRPPEAVRELL